MIGVAGTTLNKNTSAPFSSQADDAAYRAAVETGAEMLNSDYERRKGNGTPDHIALTDAGNAERLRIHYGADLRYVPAWGWLVWDGRRWYRDKLAARARAVETARLIHAEAAHETDSEIRKTITKWAERSQHAQRVRAALWLAEPDHVARLEDFDRESYLLCVRNGRIDLCTGELRDHRREDHITRVIGVDHDPDATCPHWLAFLERVQPSAEVRAFLKRWCGYSLTGTTSEQCFLVNWGGGNNGKTVFTSALFELFGEYAAQADFSTFLQRREPGIRNDLARLAGARLVAAVEGPEGAKLDAAVVKAITGGDVICARFLHREFFEFRPAFKLMLATNHRPTIHDTSEAMWRRVRLVPWTVTIAESERRPLDAILGEFRAESSGILAWCVEGCLEWQSQGLAPPEAVKLATSSYRAEEDDLGRWLEECCVVASHARTTSADLYRAYASWCESEGVQVLGKKRFGERLQERGFERDRDKRARFWHGIGLLDDRAVTR